MANRLLFYRLKKNLANYFTLLNLAAGILALKYVFEGRYDTAFYLFLAGVFFDFVDGLVARATGTDSEMGLQLDSLADLVTSGLVPGFFIYRLWKEHVPDREDVAVLALLIPLASAWRLAKFNVDPRQKSRFHGLPTPFNALVWMSVGMTLLHYPDSMAARFFKRPEVFYAGILISVYLLNSNLPLLSLKKGGNPALKPYKLILTAFSAIAVSVFFYRAIPLILIVYILLSLYAYKIKKL